MEKNQQQDYEYRISSIFQRLQTLNKNSEQDKLTKFKMTNQLIKKFEQLTSQICKNHSQKFQSTLSKLNQLQKITKQHQYKLTLHQQQIHQKIKNTQQHVRITLSKLNKHQNILQNSIKQKIKNYYSKLNQQNMKQIKDYNSTLSNYKRLVEMECAGLVKQIKQEKVIRQQIQQKIFEQFDRQISEIKDQIRHEIKERQIEEEEIIRLIKNVTMSISNKMKRQREIKRQNEEGLVKLIGTIIDKIKCEILETN